MNPSVATLRVLALVLLLPPPLLAAVLQLLGLLLVVLLRLLRLPVMRLQEAIMDAGCRRIASQLTRASSYHI